LQAAQKSLDAGRVRLACLGLAAVTLEVKVLRGKKIDAAEADQLIADTRAVRESLGCG
jgi:hypothetical protein